MTMYCTTTMTSNNLYSPYKAIGYVCDDVPFCINYAGEEIFLYTSLRNYFQVSLLFYDIYFYGMLKYLFQTDI